MFNKDKKIKKTILNLKTMTDYKYKEKIDITAKRNLVRICFIDDEGYPNIDKLNALGFYNVEVKYNFERLEDYKDYDIIFCDLDGVGKHLDATAQGLCIAEEIKTQYPNSQVFIFSGNTVDGYGKLPEDIKYVPKQTGIKELAKIIDNTCDYLWNPYKAWDRLYIRMLKEKIPSKIIAVLEDEFVQSLEKKENKFNKVEENFKVLNNAHQFATFLLSLIDILLRVSGK